MSRWLKLIVAVAAVWLCMATTTASAATFAYDVPTIARVHVHPVGGDDVAETEFTAARGGSGAPAFDARGTSTTLVSRSVATEAAGELRPAVIGEGMPNRVVPYAEQNGYVTYPGVENPASYTYDELLAHNRAQIETWTGEGRTIIDIGPEPGRAYYPMETSPNYGMEHNIVRGYPGYQPTVLPGESNWMVSHVR